MKLRLRLENEAEDWREKTNLRRFKREKSRGSVYWDYGAAVIYTNGCCLYWCMWFNTIVTHTNWISMYAKIPIDTRFAADAVMVLQLQVKLQAISSQSTGGISDRSIERWREMEGDRERWWRREGSIGWRRRVRSVLAVYHDTSAINRISIASHGGLLRHSSSSCLCTPQSLLFPFKSLQISLQSLSK